MEREIKFRAKTLDGELIYFELHESNLSGDSEVFYVNGISCESGTEQQYIGLLDRNGEEIYEGDVVKLTTNSYSEQLGISKGEWTVAIRWNKDKCSFVATDGRLTWEAGNTDFNGHGFIYEVIRNIHENPELLTNKSCQKKSENKQKT